nr:hypothetical protein [Tanacetum cinerariifolium]
MDTTIDQQVAIDEALVPHARRLRIGRSNFRLLSDISSKESTLQLVYDVLRLTLFFKAFLVTANVLKIYMQEFWATTTVHHHFIRFKMDNKKHIVNLEISEKCCISVQDYLELHHLSLKLVSGRLEVVPTQQSLLQLLLQAQDYPPDVRDDHMFTTIKLVSRHQNTQQFSALLPIELINKDIMNSNAYKEYYSVGTGATPPKPKASVRKTRSSSDTTVTPPTTAAGPRLSTSAKGKQPATTSKTKSLSALSENSTDEEGDDNDDDDEGDDGDDGE